MRCDLDTRGIEPRPVANPVCGVDPGLALCGQIGVPCLAARTSSLSEALALKVGAFKSASVSSPTDTNACDEKTHIILLSLRGCGHAYCEEKNKHDRP